jgi:type II secretory pathway predicted ATPase ExeA/septal ring-binding cell division protein DamX
MYYPFFGLRHAPFRITPDTGVFFEGGNRGAVLEALIYAIREGEGIVKVTGEVGSGKTMLCRVLQQRLAASVDIVYLANPNLPPDEILHAIAFEMQLPVTRQASRLEVMHALQDHLVRRHAARRQVVVFVEESQGMPLATLEEIRLLSNLETDRDKLLQIVLFGQPELDENLRNPAIRQLRERITHSFYLSPLTDLQIRDYLAFRLHAAGYRGPELFPKAVIHAIAQASEGLTRRVNILADKTLLSAFADNTHTLALRHVRTAVGDSEFRRRDIGGSGGARARLGELAAVPRWAWALFASALALVAVGMWWWMSGREADLRASVAASPAPRAALPLALADRIASAAEGTTSSGSIAPAMAAPAGAASTGVRAGPSAPPDVAYLRIAPELSEPAPDPFRDAREVARNDGAVAARSSARSDPTVRARSADRLEDRMAHTLAWLGRADPDTYLVQLLNTPDEEYLKQTLKNLAKSIDPDRLFVYRTFAGMRPSMSIAYGGFDSPGAARAAIAELPDSIRRFGPYHRTVRGIRTELESARDAERAPA